MQQYEASIREGAAPGTTILTLKATDQDIGKNAEVSSSFVNTDSNKLKIFTKKREKFVFYNIEVDKTML